MGDKHFMLEVVDKEIVVSEANFLVSEANINVSKVNMEFSGACRALKFSYQINLLCFPNFRWPT